MKNTMIAAFAALGLTAGVAAADDLDNTQVFTTIKTGAFEFNLEGTAENGFVGLGAKADVYTYSLGESVTGTVALTLGYVEGTEAVALGLGFGYADGVETVALGIENTITYSTGAFDLYATPSLVYVADADDLGNGDFYTAPTLGMSYDFSGTVTGFGEVTYAWNMSEDFTGIGGALEVGADFALTETVTLTPSVVRTFDTGADETQARIGLTFSF